MTMHPRTAELLAHLDDARAQLRAAVDAHPADRLRDEPAPGQWSVLAVLEHLALVEARITAVLKQKIAEARAAGIGAETATTSVFPNPVYARTLDRTTKIAAGDAIQPKQIRDLPEVLAALDETRSVLLGVLQSADGLALGEIRFPHPVFGPLDAYGWFVFVGLHELRHTDQIREIGASLAGTS